MEITLEKDGTAMRIALDGRLDTVTAPQLENQLQRNMDGVTTLDFDLTNLEYISSAGLRVLLSAQKAMNRQGSMVVHHAAPAVLDVLEVTGFTEILTLEF